MNLSDIQKFVVGKFLGETELKKLREDISSGTHHVDFTVRFSGSFSVGEDYSRPATTSIPWLESVALIRETTKCAFESLIEQVDRGQAITKEDLLAMMHSGPVSINVLVDCVKQAILRGESAVGSVSDSVEEVSQGIKEMKKDLVDRLPAQNCKGRVSVDVCANLVDNGYTQEEVSLAVNPKQVELV